jgi:hypothetical protein
MLELMKSFMVGVGRKGDQWTERKLAAPAASAFAVLNIPGVKPDTQAICLTLLTLGFLAFNYLEKRLPKALPKPVMPVAKPVVPGQK